MNEKVSVVIPAYNAELYISDCIRSVLSQTRPPEEVIIVDDCSTDSTASVVQSFAAQGVKLLRTRGNRSSAAARNLGIQAASHELIAFQDADDLWLSNHCQVVVPPLEKNRKAVLAFSRTKTFQDEDWTWQLDLPAGRPVDCFLWCAPCTRIPQMNVIARRQTLLAEGGYREAMRQAQDYDLFLRLSYKHPFICSHEITTLYRRHPGSITKSKSERSYHYMYLSQKSFEDEHSDEMTAAMLLLYRQAVAGHWERRLRDCWGAGELIALDFHLSEHYLIPGSAAIHKQWLLRRKFAALRPMWGKVLAGTRRISRKRRPSGYPIAHEATNSLAPS